MNGLQAYDEVMKTPQLLQGRWMRVAVVGVVVY